MADVKNQIKNAQYRATLSVNKQLFKLYYNIGKIIIENSSWGNKFIDNLAKDIKSDFQNLTGFSVRNLKYMAKLTAEYPDYEFVQQVVAQIPWGHNVVLLDKIKEFENRKWYLEQCVKNGWSRNVIELKTGSFKPEYAGKLNFYLSAVDNILKKDIDNPTIGLLLCKDKNKLIAEYSLKDLTKPIGVSEYKLIDVLPKDFENTLPSIEDIEKKFNMQFLNPFLSEWSRPFPAIYEGIKGIPHFK